MIVRIANANAVDSFRTATSYPRPSTRSRKRRAQSSAQSRTCAAHGYLRPITHSQHGQPPRTATTHPCQRAASIRKQHETSLDRWEKSTPCATLSPISSLIAADTRTPYTLRTDPPPAGRGEGAGHQQSVLRGQQAASSSLCRCFTMNIAPFGCRRR